jgi:hypothetical protein
MKAKFSSTPKIFSSIQTKEFLITIFLATMLITFSNYVLTKEKE